jgi:hypothetical protein
MAIDTDAFIKAPGGRHVPVELQPDGEIVLPKEFSVRKRAARASQAHRAAGQPVHLRTAKTVRLKAAPAAALYKVDQALTRVIDVLGNNATAVLLGVSISQPSRWKSGKEGLSRVNASAVVQLDAFLATMLTVFTPEQAELWLAGSEPHLGGARPADVFRLRGLAGVLPALQAIEEGAYA